MSSGTKELLKSKYHEAIVSKEGLLGSSSHNTTGCWEAIRLDHWAH
jgi:hypothetical protein